LNDEVERLNAELAEVTAARDDFFDQCDRYAKRIKELEAKLLTEDKRDRILKALLVGKQSSQYKRLKAALDQMMP
jgi:septal ring factor EnvC (AmiA/AmiB activator)